jgi:hypothetical protein
MIIRPKLEIDFSENLVGGFNPPEKYESQIGSSSQLWGKIKFMFQTTNQNGFWTSFSL